MLKCSDCTHRLHFECTGLPVFQLSILRRSNRKFTCHSCANIDPDVSEYMKTVSAASLTTSHNDSSQSVPAECLEQASVASVSSVNPPVTASATSHVACMQAIRDLESSLVDRFYETIKENYDMKLALMKKDNDNLVQANQALRTELKQLKQDLSKSHSPVKDNTPQIHQIRLDIAKAKDQTQKCANSFADIQHEIEALKSHNALILEKDRQIAALQELLHTVEAQASAAREEASAAREEAYEAKRTQRAVDTSDFQLVTSDNRASRQQHVTSVPPVPKQSFNSEQSFNTDNHGSTHGQRDISDSQQQQQQSIPYSAPAISDTRVSSHNQRVNSDDQQQQQRFIPNSAPRVESQQQQQRFIPNSAPRVESQQQQQRFIPNSAPRVDNQQQQQQFFQHSAPKVDNQQQQQFFPSSRADNQQPQQHQQFIPFAARSVPSADVKSVIVIGNSHLSNVDANRLVPNANVNILPAFTIPDVHRQLNSLSVGPDIIVIHEITNSVKHMSPPECAQVLLALVNEFSTKFPTTKFIISLGIPRLDEFNFCVEMVNAQLKHLIRLGHFPNVSFCDHSNFLKNGSFVPHLMDRDKFHLSPEGTRLFCSNLRCKIEITLGRQGRRRQVSR